MARLLLAEGEDLLARFHPHRGSYAGRYIADLLWAAYGLLGWYVARTPGNHHPWLALLTIALLSLPMIFVPRVRKEGVDVLAIVWGIAAVALWVALPNEGDIDLAWVALGLGILAALVGLGRTELARARRLTAVTNRRIVLRGGLGRMEERTIDLDRIDSVRAVQPTGGQVLGYADLVLTLASRGRTKAGAVAPHELIRGVPKWEQVKHRLESAMEERRLTPKQREKAAEERRLRDSMQAVAGWAGREGGLAP